MERAVAPYSVSEHVDSSTYKVAGLRGEHRNTTTHHRTEHRMAPASLADDRWCCGGCTLCESDCDDPRRGRPPECAITGRSGRRLPPWRSGRRPDTDRLPHCRRNRRPSLCRRWVGVGALRRADRRVSTGLCRGSCSGRSTSRPRPAPPVRPCHCRHDLRSCADSSSWVVEARLDAGGDPRILAGGRPICYGWDAEVPCRSCNGGGHRRIR